MAFGGGGRRSQVGEGEGENGRSPGAWQNRLIIMKEPAEYQGKGQTTLLHAEGMGTKQAASRQVLEY